MNRFENMNCERIEALLPAFVEHDLSFDEKAAVTSHLDSCAGCREALAALVSLEEALVSRRDEVPAIDGYLHAISAQTESAKRPFWIRGIRLVTSVPGVAIVLVMWATFMIVRFSSRLEGDGSVTTSFDRVTAFCKRGLDAMVGAAGGDAWTLTAVYGALAIGLIVSAGALTMRLVRD